MGKKEIPNNWNFYQCKIEDIPASIRLNFALYGMAPIENYKHRLEIFIHLNNPDANGFPTNEEAELLYNIEDVIYEEVEKLDGIVVGMIKSNGIFEMDIYTKNPNEIENACKKVLAHFSNYKCEINIQEDGDWDFYFNFLYPDEYSYQAMLNRGVVENLMQQGDNLEIDREVDHWIYFSSKEDRAVYIHKIKSLGYKILSENYIEEEKDYPYSLNISRLNKVSLSHINEIVWELIETIDSLEAYYDGWGCPIAK